MPRAPLPHLVALILGVAAALAVGCGDRSNLIPASKANAMEQQLADIKARIDQGDCNGITADVRKFRLAVTDDLSGKVDRELRQRLREGADSLAAHAATDCAEVRDGLTQPTETTDTQTTETETTPTETETTVTTTTQPTDTTAQPTTSTPSTTEPSTATPGGVTGTTPDNGNGGVVPPEDDGTDTP
ncbi:hypothetical protein [Baekduia sp. Peel2402]|uniref:hypothetical protein n=1 Tax=Baekduia sp. Peel2402 TaxID=3458296 RepID=UPI00403ECE59